MDNRLSWDQHHMLLAIIAAQRSPDPSTHVGAVVVNHKNTIISTGYNAFPRGIPQNALTWDRDNPEENKYMYVVHAEANAVLNTTENLEGAKVYCTLFPCTGCMKILIQKGIKEVVYLDDKYSGTPDNLASKKMAEIVEMKLRKFEFDVVELATKLTNVL
jgi:dCMP deaminase